MQLIPTLAGFCCCIGLVSFGATVESILPAKSQPELVVIYNHSGIPVRSQEQCYWFPREYSAKKTAQLISSGKYKIIPINE